MGYIAIDPECGRFALVSEKNDLIENITAEYNYAFSADIGTGTFERRSTLKPATFWISKKGHIPYACPSF